MDISYPLNPDLLRTVAEGTQYIEYAAASICESAEELYGLDVQVVYGGGLKEESVREISRIPSVSGGLAALTKFTAPIGFSPEGLKAIIDAAVSF